MLNHAGVGAEMMRVMSDDVESLCPVKECRELEEGSGTSFTDELLSGAESVDFRDVRTKIRKIDREKMLERCAEKSQLIVEVGKEVGWSKLWDSVIDLGPRHVRGLQNLSRMFSAHGRGNRPCPLCDEELEGLLVEHIMDKHRERLNLELTFEIMIARLKMVDLNFVCVFYGLYVHL